MALFSKSQPLEIGREYPDSRENTIVADMIRRTKMQMERLYVNTRTLRQVHAKMHGCLKAEFIIEKELPEELRVGLFKEARSYCAWIRFSNGKSQVLNDKQGDTRGMAIKLMGVVGEKLLDGQKNALTQDLVLASSPVFFAKNLAQFNGLLKASIAKNDKLAVALFFLQPWHWGIAKRTFSKLLIKCKHLFELSYFSGTPYQFGDETRAVKYHIQPSATNKLVFTDASDPNFLRKNMVATLAANDASFDFFIQFQTDADAMPIEDASVAWTSPFIKVATIRIPAQVFDNPTRDLFGDNLTYNIWHSLPAHRPLGGFNRARKFIYQELYTFRSDRNQVMFEEPEAGTGFLYPENLK